MKKAMLSKYLDDHESAPSALCMVQSVVKGDSLTDEECDSIYNSSEGYCDSKREDLVRILTDEQLNELHEMVLEIMLEKVSDQP